MVGSGDFMVGIGRFVEIVARIQPRIMDLWHASGIRNEYYRISNREIYDNNRTTSVCIILVVFIRCKYAFVNIN